MRPSAEKAATVGVFPRCARWQDARNQIINLPSTSWHSARVGVLLFCCSDNLRSWTSG